MFNRIKTAVLLGAAMLFASPVFASIPRDPFNLQPHRTETGHPSENRVGVFQVEIIVEAGFLPMQDAETHQVKMVPVVRCASGRSYQWLGGYGVFYDASANLHLTLHRAYSADMRRFISADPMGIDGGANLYAYGALNPLAFVDPYGLCAESGGFWNWLDNAGSAASEWKTGIGEALYNFPQNTWNAVTHPIQAIQGIPSGLSSAWDTLKSGNYDATGRLLGNFTGNVEIGLAAGGVVKALQNPSASSSAWPPNRGFSQSPNQAALQPGSLVDRYGSASGKFVSPQGTSFGARSLPAEFVSKPLNTYEVMKPINVDAGVSAPWFNQTGLGVQFELPQTVQQLINSGHFRATGN